MAHHLALILTCQLAGDLTMQWLGVAFPGALFGMLLLFLILCVAGGPADGMRSTAGGLIDHLGLFIVPTATAFVGVAALLVSEALSLAVAIVLPTIVAMSTVALIATLALRREPEPQHGNRESLT